MVDKLKLVLFGAFLTWIGVNTIDIKTSKPFKFNNPVPIHSTQKQIEMILSARPEMKDKTFGINFLGLKFPISIYRTVTNSTDGTFYSGKLDAEGNIHTRDGVYKLQFAHDSNWYIKP